MPRIINTFVVEDCNKRLAAAGEHGRIRLHDACGGQSLSYEDADGITRGPIPAEVRSLLEAELGRRGFLPVFDDASGYFHLA